MVTAVTKMGGFLNPRKHVPLQPPSTPSPLLRYSEAAREAEGGQGEPWGQHEAGEDVERPGAAVGLQEAVLPAGSDPGLHGPGGGGGGGGLAGAVTRWWRRGGALAGAACSGTCVEECVPG